MRGKKKGAKEKWSCETEWEFHTMEIKGLMCDKKKNERNEDRWRSKTVRLLFEVHVSVDLSKSTPQTSCTQISNLRCMSAVIGNVLLHIAVTLKRQIVTWLLMPSPSPLPPCYLRFNQKALEKWGLMSGDLSSYQDQWWLIVIFIWINITHAFPVS